MEKAQRGLSQASAILKEIISRDREIGITESEYQQIEQWSMDMEHKAQELQFRRERQAAELNERKGGDEETKVPKLVNEALVNEELVNEELVNEELAKPPASNVLSAG